MSEVTVGELFAGRRFRTETQAGKLQFVPGHYKGRRIGQGDGILSYVDPSGVLCVIPCEYVEDEWMPRGMMVRFGVQSAEVRRMPPGARLSDPGQRAMEEAGKKQPRTAASQTT